MVRSPAYPTLDGLFDLACRDGVDIRPTLLRVLTDLYVQKLTHSTDEETQYVELALRLIEGVDDETRAIVAGRLTGYRAAPIAVLNKLARAARESGAPVHAEPQMALGRELADLFFAANAEERRLILINLDAVPVRPGRKRVPASAEVIGRLENEALRNKPTEFIRTLERALGIGHALAERIVTDPSGEPIVVAARALGMNASTLQRILLFLNPAIGQSVQRVYALARLFDEISLASAENMVAIWRQAGGQQQARHEAFTWDDERKSARALATPMPQRSTRAGGPQPEPRKSNRTG